MRKFFAIGKLGPWAAMIVVTLLSMSGCAGIFDLPNQMQVYNGCVGSWIQVSDGFDNVLIAKLEVGQKQAIPITGGAGDYMELTASVFSLADNSPLGAARRSISAPTEYWSSSNGSGRSRDYRKQAQPWEVNYLSSRVNPDYSCQSGFRSRDE